MKSDKLAVYLKNEGNLLYRDRKFHEALIKYNKSLCHSEKNSENLGFVYGNRSAVCLELKKYQKCLKNIQLAIGYYPKENMDVLWNREKKCRELRAKNNKNDMKIFFKLSHKPNRAIPYVIDGLEMRQNEKFGRHLVTNKDLHVGDIITIEKAFSSVLLTQSNFVEVDPNNKYLRCAYCLKTNGFELVPCKGCCDAMFCEYCLEEAHEKFHKYECPVMENLLKSGSVHIALRIFFMALSACNGSIEELQKFIQQIDSMDKNFSIFDFDIHDPDNTKNYLRYLNTLSRSSNKFSTAQHEAILECHPKLNIIYHSHKDFIREFINRLCQINDHYFHGIFGHKVDSNGSTYSDLQQSIGTGWFPFCSLVNHSCASNILRIYIDGKIVLVVSRAIKSGSQLFDCYKVSFAKHSRDERQLSLIKRFNFKCDCEACTLNYPKPPQLLAKDPKLLKTAKKIEDELALKQFFNPKSFQECCRHMNSNAKNFPSLELVWLQKSFALMLLHAARNESENN